MQKPYIIGITGGTASGKTFVIEALKNYFEGNILVISQDQYLKNKDHDDVDRWERANFDAPSAFDNNLLAEHLKKLIHGEEVMAPVYNFANHKREDVKLLLEPKPIVILEGIQIFHEKSVRNLLNLKVFLESSPDIRLARRLLRDIDERGLTTSKLHDDIERYINTVKPMYDKFVVPMKKYANLVINTDRGSLGAAQIIIERLKKVCRSRKIIIEEKPLMLEEYKF